MEKAPAAKSNQLNFSLGAYDHPNRRTEMYVQDVLTQKTFLFYLVHNFGNNKRGKKKQKKKQSKICTVAGTTDERYQWSPLRFW